MSGYRRRKHKKKKVYRGLIIGTVVLIMGAGFTMFVLGGADNQRVAGSDTAEDDKSVIYKGETYEPKGNLETYLIAGIDSAGKVEDVQEYDGTGQCDVLEVIVRDRDTDECKLLSIDRNTITSVRSLDDDGTDLGATDIQISLAHSMGLDNKVRAENTVDVVSTLLDGQKIDGYAMVNMSAIQLVNDMVGGVTVTIEDDFSQRDPTLKMGETVTLMGEHAENYVRGRMDVGDGSNQNRMNRQNTYEEGFKTAFRAKCQVDNTFPLDVYHAMEEYMTTNISAKKFSRLAILLSDAKEDKKVSIEGTYGVDETDWQTFNPNRDSLKEAILELFYEKKK